MKPAFCAAAYKDNRFTPVVWKPEPIVLIDVSSPVGAEKTVRFFALTAAQAALDRGVKKIMFYASGNHRADLMGRHHFAGLKQEDRVIRHGLSLAHAFHALKAGEAWYDPEASHRHIVVIGQDIAVQDSICGDMMQEMHAAQVLRRNPRTTLDIIQLAGRAHTALTFLADGVARWQMEGGGPLPGFLRVPGISDISGALGDVLDSRMRGSLLGRLAEVSALRGPSLAGR